MKEKRSSAFRCFSHESGDGVTVCPLLMVGTVGEFLPKGQSEKFLNGAYSREVQEQDLKRATSG